MYMCMMRKRGFKDVLRKSYFTDDENNDKKTEIVAFFTFEFCG